MNEKAQKFETPLAKAKGLGSAHEGVNHWINQRLTAVINLPLLLWLLISFISLSSAEYEAVVEWIRYPVHTILLILAMISVFYHAYLGSRVIVEDYISNKAFRITKLVGNKIFFTALLLVNIFCILKIVFTG